MKLFLKNLNPFKKQPVKEFATETLEDYHHLYLQSQEAAEYHAKMALYYQQGIKRMGAYLTSEAV